MTGGERTEWPYVEIAVDATDADAFGSVLLDTGSTGVEQREEDAERVTLRAWFTEAPDIAGIAAAVAGCPGVDASVAEAASRSIAAGFVPNDDWLRLWKQGFEPVPIGARLVVFPSWKREQASSFVGRQLLEIDPGMAFGTGTHETTRLCLEWLDEHWRGGSIVDVGTGTGILAIAAALLAPGSSIVAVDVDHVAVDVALQNAAINGVEESILFDTCGPDRVTGQYDVVLANLTADVISLVAESLVALAKPGGTLVLSGILAEQGDWLTAELVERGLTLVERRAAGEWIALVLTRP